MWLLASEVSCYSQGDDAPVPAHLHFVVPLFMWRLPGKLSCCYHFYIVLISLKRKKGAENVTEGALGCKLLENTECSKSVRL